MFKGPILDCCSSLVGPVGPACPLGLNVLSRVARWVIDSEEDGMDVGKMSS